MSVDTDALEKRVRDSAKPLGIYADPWETDLSAAEFIHTHFLDQLRELRPHAHQDPYDNPYEACILLWQDDEGEWWATDTYNEGDDSRETANVYSVNAPAEAKNQITLHTHPPLFPELSHGDVLQMVPYTDDSAPSVGPHHAIASLTADFGGYHLMAVERTAAGREITDIDEVRKHIAEAERLHDENIPDGEEGERYQQEAARDAILRYYGEAVDESHLTFKFQNETDEE